MRLQSREVAAVAADLRARAIGSVTRIANDQLYRGSFLLLMNTAALSVLGFVFWTFAARTYPAAAVGAFSGVTAGVSLLAAVAALGLPNTMIRQLSNTENQRELVMVAATAISAVGGVLCLLTVLLLGPLLPASLHLQQRGGMVLLVTALVVFAALGSAVDAGLVAARAAHAVLIKNVAGNTAKIAALFLLAALGSAGLLLAYGTGMALALVLGGLALARRVAGGGIRLKSFRVVQRHLSMTASNYLATVMGILPTTVVPLEVLAVRGPAQTARFAIAFMLTGFLNFIPATTAQVLFAEVSRGGMPLGKQLRKALRGVYSLLLPASLLLMVAAPLILQAFGGAYAAQAAGPLRVLALSALLTGGNYLVDTLLIARDRSAAYVFMNGANAALVLGCVGAFLPAGLTAGAGGWALAQGLSLALGLIVLATGHTGRHHVTVSRTAAAASATPTAWELSADDQGVEPQLHELLAEWPTMPTTMIAEQIGWDRPIQVLLDQVTDLRQVYLGPGPPVTRVRYAPGEVAQCGFWFPPTEVPSGFGQVRSARRLPVLTMITGYSRWLTAVLIPTRRPADLSAGWWQLFGELGAVPRVLVWDEEDAIGRRQDGTADLTPECERFLATLGARILITEPADPEAKGLIERAHAYLERSFLAGRSFTSPTDFNAQLAQWVMDANTRSRPLPNRSPAERIDADRAAMLPLPKTAPATGWRITTRLSQANYIRFDSNAYSVQPAASGRLVEIAADLERVRVLCEGRVVADHSRVWARLQTIRDPMHGRPAQPNPGMATETWDATWRP
jgi:O-antigen/teichoic acid export membrane protein/transposase